MNGAIFPTKLDWLKMREISVLMTEDSKSPTVVVGQTLRETSNTYDMGGFMVLF